MRGNAPESCEHGQKREGIDGKDPSRSQGTHKETSQRRTDRSGEIEANAIQRDGGGDLIPGHQILKQGLPSWQMDRRTHAQQEKQHQKLYGAQMPIPSHHRHETGHGHHPKLGSNQQPAPVDKIGQHSAGQAK
jgi:hypothetical protein